MRGLGGELLRSWDDTVNGLGTRKKCVFGIHAVRVAEAAIDRASEGALWGVAKAHAPGATIRIRASRGFARRCL
jgi:hypothetical protein